MKLPVIWKGYEYAAINNFDCINVDLMTINGGGYFSSVPISSVEYREKYPTSAKVEITETSRYCIFKMFSDHGSEYVLKIPKYMKDEIKYAKESAIKNKLM